MKTCGLISDSILSFLFVLASPHDGQKLSVDFNAGRGDLIVANHMGHFRRNYFLLHRLYQIKSSGILISKALTSFREVNDECYDRSASLLDDWKRE